MAFLLYRKFILFPVCISLIYGHSIPEGGQSVQQLRSCAASVVELETTTTRDRYCQVENSRNESIENYEPSLKQTFAYDPETKACYPINGLDHQAPCKKPNMKFFQRCDNPDFGFCDCDQDLPTFYNDVTKKCHLLFQQDFCDDGQWLEANVGKVECKPDPCSHLRNNTVVPTHTSQILVFFEGKCDLLGSSCGESKAIKLTFNTFQPKCEQTFQFSVAGFGNSLSIPTLSCAEGTRWSTLTDSCKKTMTFDFS